MNQKSQRGISRHALPKALGEMHSDHAEVFYSLIASHGRMPRIRLIEIFSQDSSDYFRIELDGEIIYQGYPEEI